MLLHLTKTGSVGGYISAYCESLDDSDLIEEFVSHFSSASQF